MYADSSDARKATVPTMSSGVASRLSTVLQGISMAALTESSEVAQMTLERMNDKTNLIAQKEALKNAMGINLENDALVKAIKELESYGKVARAATDISRRQTLVRRIRTAIPATGLSARAARPIARPGPSGIVRVACGASSPRSTGRARRRPRRSPPPPRRPPQDP